MRNVCMVWGWGDRERHKGDRRLWMSGAVVVATIFALVSILAVGTAAASTGSDLQHLSPPGTVVGVDSDLLNVYDQTDPRIVYSGTTSVFSTASAFQGDYTRLSAGASATIYFLGSRLDWIAMKGLTTGPANVYVDDNPTAIRADLTASKATYQVKVWSTGDLPVGLHKVRIEWNATGGKYVTLDAIHIVGTIADAPPTITGIAPSAGSVDGGTTVSIAGTSLAGAGSVTFDGVLASDVTVNPAGTQVTCTAPAHVKGKVLVRVTTPAGVADSYYTYLVMPAVIRYDHTDVSIVKTGVWSDYSSAGSYGGSDGRSNTNAVSATIWFDGVRLDYIAVKGTTTGIADIYLDGSPTPTATVNLAASATVQQQLVWSTGILPPGRHSVRIVRSASSAADKYLSLDALDIAGTIVSPAAVDGPLIVIDPGHSGSSLTIIDPATRIKDYEYNNGIENTEMWAVSLKLKAKLEAAGYRVLLTKGGPKDTVSKRARVDIADKHGAAMAVSIHRDSHTFGTWGEICVQRTDGYRVNVDGRRVYFDLPGVAAKSVEYGNKILAARRAIEGPAVAIKVNVFTGRTNLAAGNLPMVQLFSKTPWVYCESGMCDTDARQELYAQGVFDGINEAVPVDGSAPEPPPVPDHTRYEQTDFRIGKSGTWATFTTAPASAGSYGRAAVSGASTTITFNGTRLDWIAMKGTTTGYALVYLDSMLMTPIPIDLTASTPMYQVPVWSTGDLGAPGFHTVRIVRYVYANGTGSTKYLTLDAVDIWGTIQTPS